MLASTPVGHRRDHGAQQRGFHVMAEFFLTEALFNLHTLPPLTD